MALEDTTGGLEAVDPQIKATMPKTGGLSLAGQKGVSLNPADSSEIRSRLMQMIQQREEAASGWGPIMERAAVSAGAPGTFAQNLQSFGTNQRNKEKELFDMRVGLAQLNTEEARVKQAQDLAAQNQLNFTNAMRADQGLPPLPSAPQAGMTPAPQAGGAAPAPQDGAAPTPQAGAAPAPARPSNITPTQMAMLQQMYADPSTRAEAQKQYFALTKQDDIMRRLRAAGVQEGSPTWNQMLALNVAGASAFTPHDVRGVGGTGQQTPFGAVGAALGTTPPTAPAPAPVVAPTAAVTPAAPARAPTATIAPAAPTMAPAVPTQAGLLSPSSKEGIELQKQREAIPIAAAAREAEEVAKTYAEEQKQHSLDVKEAKTNALTSQSMQKDIRTANSLLGKLAGGGAQSAFFGLIDRGIQVGQLGTVNAPGFTEAVVKMDPNAKKPEVMDAYIRVAKDVEGLKLAYTRKVFDGQGAVSNSERDLISTAVGDVNRMSPANLMRMAKATELEARNKMDQDRLWAEMKGAGMSWSQYKSSKELADMQRNQFYRSAKTFGINDAKYPGDK
jgi:hypothetical protein